MFPNRTIYQPSSNLMDKPFWWWGWIRRGPFQEPVGKPALLEADGKSPYARHPKSRGMRRTYKYAAVMRDEDNTADGGFPTASQAGV
jgi:hypothetical protein